MEDDLGWLLFVNVEGQGGQGRQAQESEDDLACLEAFMGGAEEVRGIWHLRGFRAI